MAKERLQKILSHAGYGSRRANEELISSGRVSVNGQTASLGDKADPERDKITVDGRPVKLAEEMVYVAVYKPRNVISAVTADDPRKTVRDLIPLPGHLYPVGRLDVDSEGLMLLTNDGELANRLTHPRYGHEKEYRVLVARHPDQQQLDTWKRGVVLEDGYRTAPAEVRVESLAGKGAWLRVILREGRKRQIRETGFQLGLPVVKIIRIRIGSLQLGGMKSREWRFLSGKEVDELKGRGTPASQSKTSAPRQPRREGAASQSRRSASRSRSGSSTKKNISKAKAGGQPGKPGRRPGGSPGGKSGASTDRASRPERPGSPPRKTERRGARRPTEKGKHK